MRGGEGDGGWQRADARIIGGAGNAERIGDGHEREHHVVAAAADIGNLRCQRGVGGPDEIRAFRQALKCAGGGGAGAAVLDYGKLVSRRAGECRALRWRPLLACDPF